MGVTIDNSIEIFCSVQESKLNARKYYKKKKKGAEKNCQYVKMPHT